MYFFKKMFKKFNYYTYIYKFIIVYMYTIIKRVYVFLILEMI